MHIIQHISKAFKNHPYIYQLSCTTLCFFIHILVPAPTLLGVC